MKHQKLYLTVRLKSFHPYYLNRFVFITSKKFRAFFPLIEKQVFLPKRVERFTVLRSPHVDKKARDQYIFILYRKVIKQRVDLQYNNYIYHYIIIFFNMYLNRINKNFYNVLKLNYKYNYLIKKKNEDLHSTKKLIYRIMY